VKCSPVLADTISMTAHRVTQTIKPQQQVNVSRRFSHDSEFVSYIDAIGELSKGRSSLNRKSHPHAIPMRCKETESCCICGSASLLDDFQRSQP